MKQLTFFEKSVEVIDTYGTVKVLKTIILVAMFLFVAFGVPLITKYVVEGTMKGLDNKRELIHTKELEQRRAIQPQVYSVFNKMMASTQSQRVFIIELHNGSHNINGVPFLHGTVTYEQVADGYDNIDEDFQNVSLSRYQFSNYLHNNYNFIGSIQDVAKIDKKFAQKLSANDVSYVAVTSLHDGNKEWGWFGILYSNNMDIPSKDLILKELLIHSQSITNLLSTIKKPK